MAQRRGVKVKDGERLEDANIARVIELLENPEPITKKVACEILNISYNTTRLATIIQNYKDKIERRKKNFEKNRGKPLTDSDISYIVKAILTGESVSEISEVLFRSPGMINNVIDKLGIPRRLRGETLASAQLLPEECIISSAKEGQIVWSARYHAAAEVIKLNGRSQDGLSDIYRIYVYESTESRRRGGFYANQRIEDLGSLSHLEKYVNIDTLTK